MLRFSLTQKMVVFAILFHINAYLTNTLGISRNAHLHPSLLAFRANCRGSSYLELNCSSFIPLRSFTALLLHRLQKTETYVLRKIFQAFFFTSLSSFWAGMQAQTLRGKWLGASHSVQHSSLHNRSGCSDGACHRTWSPCQEPEAGCDVDN